jgi:hypothetical protein
VGPDGISLWDDDDGFFYDVLHHRGGDGPGGHSTPIKVRSIVGAIPLFAVCTIDPEVLAALPDFSARMRWFIRRRPDLCGSVESMEVPGQGERRLLAILGGDRLRRVLARLFDPERFLSDHGIRSLSRHHLAHPVRIHAGGALHEITYEPGDSATEAFGGNSNWRGPVWFPINFLLIESLQRFHHYLGDGFTVEFPTGSGHHLNLWEVSMALSRRLTALFLPDASGHRPVNGERRLLDAEPFWHEHVTFSEFFHGETGAGLGASHQGWTTLVAKLIRQSGA